MAHKRPKVRQLRRLVTDYTLNFIDEHPDATKEEIEVGVKQRLTEDFGEEGIDDYPILKMLLELFIQLLPLLLSLKKPQ